MRRRVGGILYARVEGYIGLLLAECRQDHQQENKSRGDYFHDDGDTVIGDVNELPVFLGDVLEYAFDRRNGVAAVGLPHGNMPVLAH